MAVWDSPMHAYLTGAHTWARSGRAKAYHELIVLIVQNERNDLSRPRIAMMQTTDLRDGDNLALLSRLSLARHRSISIE